MHLETLYQNYIPFQIVIYKTSPGAMPGAISKMISSISEKICLFLTLNMLKEHSKSIESNKISEVS